jgi:CDP-diglyceride synthetase
MEGSIMMGENMFGNTMWAGHWLWMLVIAIAVVIPAWRICQRTGFPGWMGVLILIPIVNLALLYFIAFADWPVERDSEGRS